jgi:cobalamin synthase
VDSLFSDIYETKQLKELKEEVSVNLMEKINDYTANGESKESAFEKAKEELGDMSELIESLKKVSSEKKEDNGMNNLGLDRKHILGYLTASTILLFGLMTSGILYLQNKDIERTAIALMPFFIISVALYVYFGLTQETPQDYGMSSKRAIAYSLATALILLGIFAAGFMYFSGEELFTVLATLMPFALPSGVIYIYLGLTEKSRRKMDSAWQKQWVDYYSNPETMMVRGNISGALWIFAIAVFLLVGFLISWKYSWIVFIFAIGFEVLIEAYFSATKKNK